LLQLQCLKENGHGVRVVESSTRLVDIPYGDYFSVEERWTVVPISSNACKIFIELKVRRCCSSSLGQRTKLRPVFLPGGLW
jgi:hypothetical protein